jgi:acyl carrier protein
MEVSWDIEKIEDYLSKKIAEIIEKNPEDIDVDKVFSDYSIDSASGVGLSGDIEEDFNLKLSPLVLFEYPTIAKLSKYILKKLNK